MFGTLRAQDPVNIENILSQINADSLLRTVMDLQNFGSRFAIPYGSISDGNRDVADYVSQRLEEYGITTSIDSFYKEGTAVYMWASQWFYNVKGVLLSSTPIDDSLVVVGAHLDAIALSNYGAFEIAPGADDNASGVAVMIELARICHANNLQFRRNIHFMAYDAEEFGLWGSDHDAQARNEVGEKIALMMNNDMVSYQPDDNWRIQFRWYDNAVDVVNRASSICEQYTNLTPYVAPEAENWELATRSDSYSYYRAGYRAIFAHEYTFSTSYHTDHDLADSNNYPYLAEVTRYNMAMLTAFANPTSGVGVNEYPAALVAHVYPNPVANTLTVQYQLDKESPVSITVLDLTGRTVLSQPEALQSAGINHTSLDFTSLPIGMYLCQIRTAKGVETIKVVRQ